MCQVDIAYVPFIERLEIAFSGLENYDITAGRPNLAKWLKAMNTVDAYNETKLEHSVLLDIYKRMLEMDYFRKVGIVTDEKKAAATPVATN
jgi:glutathione S-transferase